jgi:hypothetical protein
MFSLRSVSHGATGWMRGLVGLYEDGDAGVGGDLVKGRWEEAWKGNGNLMGD